MCKRRTVHRSFKNAVRIYAETLLAENMWGGRSACGPQIVRKEKDCLDRLIQLWPWEDCRINQWYWGKENGFGMTDSFDHVHGSHHRTSRWCVLRSKVWLVDDPPTDRGRSAHAQFCGTKQPEAYLLLPTFLLHQTRPQLIQTLSLGFEVVIYFWTMDS